MSPRIFDVAYLLEIGAVPVVYATWRLYERVESLGAARILPDIAFVEVQRSADVRYFRARSLYATAFDVADHIRCGERSEQTQYGQHNQQFEKRVTFVFFQGLQKFSLH